MSSGTKWLLFVLIPKQNILYFHKNGKCVWNNAINLENNSILEQNSTSNKLINIDNEFLKN